MYLKETLIVRNAFINNNIYSCYLQIQLSSIPLNYYIYHYLSIHELTVFLLETKLIFFIAIHLNYPLIIN